MRRDQVEHKNNSEISWWNETFCGKYLNFH